ncbi:MAG: hypothetical protein OXI79_08930 [Gammaproteobacteria bacterium]|nr:hypothetical protein [Gammaproteobacteria bacterium]
MSKAPLILIVIGFGLQFWDEFPPDHAAAQQMVQLPPEDRRLEPGFEEVFRVGGMVGEVWEQFGMIEDVAFDGAGNLYLLDADALNVVVVDHEGDFIRTMGRAGNGPGEFDFPRWLAVLEDGRIVVSDIPRHRAFQIYNSDGSFDRNVRVGNDLLAIGDRIHGGRNAVVFAGPALAQVEEMVPENEKDPPGKRRILRALLEGGEVVWETVFQAWGPPFVGELTLRIGGREIPMGGVTPPPRTLRSGLACRHPARRGLAFSDSSAYAIKILDPGGVLVRILTRPIHPVPVTDRIVEAEFERRVGEAVADFVARGQRPRMIQNAVTGETVEGVLPLDEAMLEGVRLSTLAQLEAVPVADEVPVVLDLRTTWGGQIWVQRRGEDLFSDGSIDVLTSDGRYLGSYPAGTPMPVAFGLGGLLAVLETDEWGTQSVIVRRVSSAL